MKRSKEYFFELREKELYQDILKDKMSWKEKQKREW